MAANFCVLLLIIFSLGSGVSNKIPDFLCLNLKCVKNRAKELIFHGDARNVELLCRFCRVNFGYSYFKHKYNKQFILNDVKLIEEKLWKCLKK